MASTIMFAENRWYTHITIMSMSLIITVASRPYVDNESYMIAILFCVIDILGAIASWLSYYCRTDASTDSIFCNNDASSPEFQTVFVIALLFALLVVVVLAFKAMGERIRILHNTMIHGIDNQSIWKAYTTCEVIFLSPILVIVFVVSYIAKVLCCKFSNQKDKNRSSPTVVVPVPGNEKNAGSEYNNSDDSDNVKYFK